MDHAHMPDMELSLSLFSHSLSLFLSLPLSLSPPLSLPLYSSPLFADRRRTCTPRGEGVGQATLLGRGQAASPVNAAASQTTRGQSTSPGRGQAASPVNAVASQTTRGQATLPGRGQAASPASTAPAIRAQTRLTLARTTATTQPTFAMCMQFPICVYV